MIKNTDNLELIATVRGTTYVHFTRKPGNSRIACDNQELLRGSTKETQISVFSQVT